MNQYVLHQSHIILRSNNFRLVRLTGTQEKISFILEFLYVMSIFFHLETNLYKVSSLEVMTHNERPSTHHITRCLKTLI